MLKPWTHKHKKTFSRKLFNNILLSARPTKRLIKTAFRTKIVRKTVIWKNRKKGNSASEWFLKNSRNDIFCCSPEIRFSLWKMELLPLSHPFSNPTLGKEYLRFVCLFATSTFINPVFLTPVSLCFPAWNLSSAHFCCLCSLFPTGQCFHSLLEVT